MRNIYLLIFVIAMFSNASAQNNFNKKFDNITGLKVWDFDQDNIVVSGYNFQYYLTITCVDKLSGDQKWTINLTDTSYTGHSCGTGYGLQFITSRKTFIISGGLACSAHNDYFIFEIDTTGNILWEKEIPGIASFANMFEMEDGSIKFFSSKDFITYHWEPVYGRFDSLGNLLETMEPLAIDKIYFNSVIRTKDNGFLTTSKKWGTPMLYDAIAVKFDSAMNFEYSRTIYLSSMTLINSVVELSDSSFVGIVTEYSGNPYLMRFNKNNTNGEVLKFNETVYNLIILNSDTTFDVFYTDTAKNICTLSIDNNLNIFDGKKTNIRNLRTIIPSTLKVDSDYYLTFSFQDSLTSQTQSWLFKSDSSLSMNCIDFVPYIPATTRQIYTLITDTMSFDPNGLQFPLVSYRRYSISTQTNQWATDSCMLFTSIIDTPSEIKFEVYPNPATNNFNISSTSDCTIEIFDLNGSIRQSLEIRKGKNEINTSTLQAGMYFIRSISTQSFGKVVIIR